MNAFQIILGLTCVLLTYCAVMLTLLWRKHDKDEPRSDEDCVECSGCGRQRCGDVDMTAKWDCLTCEDRGERKARKRDSAANLKHNA